jgi:hypothetical protein
VKAFIEVENRKEADELRRGLDEPDVRAFVRIVGALRDLPEGGQRRVLAYMRDLIDSERARAADPVHRDLGGSEDGVG